jgi:trimeric autotransporter adhesin
VLTVAGLDTGSHPISVVFTSGGTSLGASVQQNVLPNRTAIAINLAAGIPVCGQATSLMAQVGGAAPAGVPAPTGNVQFFDGTTLIGTGTISGGVVTLATGALHAGVHPITAVYQGDRFWYQAQSNVAPETVAQATTSATVAVLPDFSGTSGVVNLTATVGVGAPSTCIADGVVQFRDDKTGAVIASAPVTGGVAKVSVPTADIARNVNALYVGTPDTLSSAAPAVPQLALYSAADFVSPHTSSDEIMSIFGSGLASGVFNPSTLGTSLGGATVKVTDSTGAAQLATLFYASTTQINLLVPSGLAPGTTTFTVTTANGGTLQVITTAANVVPGLFTANSNGTGVAAAQILRVHADGSSAVENVATIDPASQTAVGAPIDFGAAGDKLYLLAYGTGLRHAVNSKSVTATINGINIPVLYAGAQPTFPGLDQVNLGPLPPSLAGSGTVNLEISVDGVPTNVVTLTFK